MNVDQRFKSQLHLTALDILKTYTFIQGKVNLIDVTKPIIIMQKRIKNCLCFLQYIIIEVINITSIILFIKTMCAA